MKLELTLSIFNNLSIVSFHHCDAGIGSAQINSNNAKYKKIRVESHDTYVEKFLCDCKRLLVFYFFKSVLNILCFLI